MIHVPSRGTSGRRNILSIRVWVYLFAWIMPVNRCSMTASAPGCLRAAVNRGCFQGAADFYHCQCSSKFHIWTVHIGQSIFGRLRRCKYFKAEICRKLRTKNMPFYIIENYFHFFVISSVQHNKFYVLFAPALGGGIFLKQD